MATAHGARSCNLPEWQHHPKDSCITRRVLRHLSSIILPVKPSLKQKWSKKPCKSCPFGCCQTSFSRFWSDGRSYSSCSYEPTPASPQIRPNTKSFHLLNLLVVFLAKATKVLRAHLIKSSGRARWGKTYEEFLCTGVLPEEVQTCSRALPPLSSHTF